MFKIQPVEDAEIAKAIFPSLSDYESLFVVNEEGRFTGTGVCRITEKDVTILKLSAPFDDARTLLFLGMLNYAERRGIKKAYCKDPALEDLCRRMDFSEDGSVDLTGFFDPGRHCKH